VKKVIKYLLNKNKQTQNAFEKKSYSQCGEDIIVKYLFDNIGIFKPTYLDIGAHHPFYLSNTAIFYESGCTGINIEPDPNLFSSFLTNRNRDINLNIGIGLVNETADFYLINVPTLNTFSKSEAENYSKEGDFFIKEVKKIELNTLSFILEKYCNNIFPDFLSLDAEGVDEIIIKNLESLNSKPTIICIETISFSQSGNGVKNNNIIEYLNQNGYLMYADTNINSIFILKEKWIR
jgi:FkbM family methyltransferase